MPMDGVPASSASSPSASAPAKTTEGKPGQPQARASEPKNDADGNPFKGTKHKLNVNGKEREYEYEEVLTRAQKAEAAEEKFQRAAQIEKDVEAFFDDIAKGDPKALAKFKKRVPDAVWKQIVLNEAWQQMEYDNLPPERKKEMELDEREKRLKDLEENSQKSEKQKVWQSQVNEAGSAITKLIDNFKEKTRKNPSSAELMRMTELMLAHSTKYPGELPPVEMLYERASRSLEYDAKDFLGKKSQNIQELMQWLPDDVKKALKKHFQDEALSTHPRRFGQQTEEAPQRSRKQKPMGIDAFFESVDRKQKGRR